MQWNTVVKFGSLAFNVAQDSNVQELFTMIHKGARRRGMIGVVPAQPTPAQPTAPSPSSAPANHPVPFAPKAPSANPAPSVPAGLDLSKYLNAENAKKALGIAGQISSFLIK